MSRARVTVGVQIVDGVQGPRSSVVAIVRRASRVVRPRSSMAVALILCGRSRIHALNRTYRHKNAPTDVLSFSYGHTLHTASGEAGREVGEIYICVPVARQQAKQYGNSFQDELRLLAVHGYLHILGHDHATARQARNMRSLENKILGKKISRSSS